MASALIENLSAASALATTDLFYVKQAGARGVKATGTQLLALVGTAYVPLAGGTMTGALTIASGTLTASAPGLNITQTWNQGATQFESIAVDVTNTASGSSASYFVGKTAGSINLRLRRDGYVVGTGLITANVNTEFYGPGIRIASGAAYSWCQFGTDSAVWVSLYGEAAGTLAQRNGTNAQTLRVYRSYTDASNYSRFTHSWNTSTALLMAEGLGTGTDGNVAFNDEALATGATRGYIMVPSAAGVSTGRPADIPTGQTPIVFDSTNKRIGAYTGDAWVWTAALA